MKKTVILFLILGSLAGAVSAEEIYLKKGDVISGSVTGSDSESIRVKTSYGEVLIRQEEILRIEYVKPAQDEEAAPLQAEKAPAKKLKTLSVGFQMDMIGYYSGMFLCPPVKWWVTPAAAIQFEYNVFELYGSGPTIIIKGLWGFLREDMRYLSVGGGVVLMNTGYGLSTGFMGIISGDVLRDPEIPYAISAEIGYYYGPVNSYYLYYGSFHNLWLAVGYNIYLF